MKIIRFSRTTGEQFTPHKHKDGSYHLFDPKHGSEKYKQQNVIKVHTLKEVAEGLHQGFHLRMRGERKRQISIIRPVDIIIDGTWLNPASEKAALRHPDKSWTDHEMEAAVDAYLFMLNKELANEPYNKARINRQLRDGALRERSKGSVELRMQNISAALQELWLPWIKGYKPRGHVGAQKNALLLSLLERKGMFNPKEFRATYDRSSLEQKTDALLKKLKNNHPKSPPQGNQAPPRTRSETTQYVRDPSVCAWVLKASDGNCEACGNAAPFTKPDGNPYLEVHHLKPLAEGGPDTINNAVAVCPNCHRRFHHSHDKAEFIQETLQKVRRLKHSPKLTTA